MSLRNSLRELAEALPEGSAIPVPCALLLELLGPRATTTASAEVVSIDLDVITVAELLRRKPSTIRAWCAAGELEGSYRLNQREWRIPRSALTAFLARRRDATPSPRSTRAGAPVDLGAWRRQRRKETS